MISEFPVTNQSTDFQFSAILSGTRYYIRFYYNRRIDTWFVNLLDANQEIILSGIAALTNVQSMFTRFSLDDVLPFGDMMILDSAGNGRDATLLNFSEVVSAFYVSIL